MSKLTSELTPNPRNPRKIDKNKIQMLAKSMIEFGSLDGFINNTNLGRLEGGHQRLKVIPADAIIKIEKTYDAPTAQGTIAVGYVEYMGERWPYREVNWDENKSKAANIAANKGAGDWDWQKLQDFILELDAVNFDLDLTMFDETELKNMFDVKEDTKKSINLNFAFKIEVDCCDEETQESLTKELEARGLKIRVLI